MSADTRLRLAENKTSSKVHHKHTKANVTPITPIATGDGSDFDDNSGKKHDVSQFFKKE